MSIDFPGKRALVVVAHPDDETMWCGGTIAKYPDTAWTVLCCSTPSVDPIRAHYFADACKSLGATAMYALNSLDMGPDRPLDLSPTFLTLLLYDFDCVITHGARGEYGHPHHRQVHQWVLAECKGYRKPLFAFTYDKPGAFGGALTADDWSRKLEALKCYRHELPYAGELMPKWAALLKRYAPMVDLQYEGFDLVRTK